MGIIQSQVGARCRGATSSRQPMPGHRRVVAARSGGLQTAHGGLRGLLISRPALAPAQQPCDKRGSTPARPAPARACPLAASALPPSCFPAPPLHTISGTDSRAWLRCDCLPFLSTWPLVLTLVPGCLPCQATRLRELTAALEARGLLDDVDLDLDLEGAEGAVRQYSSTVLLCRHISASIPRHTSAQCRTWLRRAQGRRRRVE
jgi:hypothetical protein